MPFGLVTAPATFSRLMRKLLYGMTNINNFIDDIIIFTTDVDQHVAVLSELLTRLRNANRTAKPGKCAIGYTSIKCLGHIVGENKLQPHPDKVKAIQEAVEPTTKRKLRYFLGLLSFLQEVYSKLFINCVTPYRFIKEKGRQKACLESASGEIYSIIKILACTITYSQTSRFIKAVYSSD